ncbi:hypothetical protein NQ318_006169, partial [Aromia moschata]
MNKYNGPIPTSPLFALINKDSYGSVNRGNKFGINSANRRLSVRLISETLDNTKTIVHEIVSESLGMRKLCAKLVPKVLTDDQKARR